MEYVEVQFVNLPIALKSLLISNVSIDPRPSRSKVLKAVCRKRRKYIMTVKDVVLMIVFYFFAGAL